MKPRIPLVLTMLLVLLMAGSVPAAADSATVPFNGYYAVSPRIIGVDEKGCALQELPSVGQATHLGRSTWDAAGRFCPNPDGMTGTNDGTFTFTSADGSQLSGWYEGWVEVVYEPVPLATFGGTYWMTEGKGRFAGYTGKGEYLGLSGMGDTGEMWFEGTLTKPEKP